MEEIYELVRALRAALLPRNRNYEAYASAAGKKARRIHRFLLGVERDLVRADKVTATEGADGALHLELSMPALRVLRTVELDGFARALLLENEPSAVRLVEAGAAAPPVPHAASA